MVEIRFTLGRQRGYAASHGNAVVPLRIENRSSKLAGSLNPNPIVVYPDMCSHLLQFGWYCLDPVGFFEPQPSYAGDLRFAFRKGCYYLEGRNEVRVVTGVKLERSQFGSFHR